MSHSNPQSCDVQVDLVAGPKYRSDLGTGEEWDGRRSARHQKSWTALATALTLLSEGSTVK